jgi:DNA (cytosine-5)-methyltransferase 1
MSNKLNYISLFSGAGLFDIGFNSAGFKPVLSIDSNHDACESIKLNYKHLVVNSRIENFQIAEYYNKKDIKNIDLDLLVGGPPCQPYSKSKYGVTGNATPGKEDSRFDTIKHYMKFVRVFKPKVFIIENVPQIFSGKNLSVKSYLENATNYINRNCKTSYRLTYHKFNCSWYGVPQSRERIFIIASRDGTRYSMPEMTHFESGDKELGTKPFVTAKNAIGYINKLVHKRKTLVPTGQWSELLAEIPPGENYLWHTERKPGKTVFKWRSRFWNFLLKLHPDKPSWTITANPGHMTGPFHWSGRRLSIEELKVLQTVPINYKLSGSNRSQIKQIGNGVPSLIGEVLGIEIRNQLLNKSKKRKEYKLAILKKSNITRTLTSP